MLRIKSPQNLGAAAILCAMGICGLVFGADLRVGTAARMGPGYFPFVLSIGLIFFGLLALLRAVRIDGPAIEVRSLRPIAIIVGAMLVFGALVEDLGFVLVGIGVTIIAAFARRNVNLGETVLLAVGLCAFAVTVFVFVLGLPLSLWGR